MLNRNEKHQRAKRGGWKKKGVEKDKKYMCVRVYTRLVRSKAKKNVIVREKSARSKKISSKNSNIDLFNRFILVFTHILFYKMFNHKLYTYTYIILLSTLLNRMFACIINIILLI